MNSVTSIMYDQTVDLLNQSLRMSIVNDKSVQIATSVFANCTPAVRDQVLQAFRDGGWDIELYSDDDGPRYYFSENPKNRPTTTKPAPKGVLSPNNILPTDFVFEGVTYHVDKMLIEGGLIQLPDGRLLKPTYSDTTLGEITNLEVVSSTKFVYPAINTAVFSVMDRYREQFMAVANKAPLARNIWARIRLAPTAEEAEKIAKDFLSTVVSQPTQDIPTELTDKGNPDTTTGCAITPK